jgi:putative ABC transport system permease protein
MTPFRLAILNLFRRPLSTWISILGIATAVAASGILLKVYILSQSRFQTIAREGQSVVGAKAGGIEILLGSLNLEGPYPGFLPINLYNSIKSQQTVRFEDGGESTPSYVTAVIPFLYFAKFGDYRIIGTTADFMKRPTPADNPELAEGTWVIQPGDVVVGASVAAEKSLKPGSNLRAETVTGASSSGVSGGVSGSVAKGFEMHVSGILKPTGKIWDHALFGSLEDAQRVLSQTDLLEHSIWGANVLNYFLIYHDASAFPRLKSLIDQRTVGQLISIESELKNLENLTGTGRTFGLLLTCLILFLSSTSVAGMMVARFDSMSVQLAILRAIGYERSEIARWLLWEGLILGIIACVIGAIVDFSLFPWIRSVSGLDLPSYVPSPIFQSAIVWLAAIAVTIAAVAIPLMRLYRQDINAALKA